MSGKDFDHNKIEQEVKTILKEIYGPYLRGWGKKCLMFCGDTCTCEQRVPFTIREKVRMEVMEKMRV